MVDVLQFHLDIGLCFRLVGEGWEEGLGGGGVAIRNFSWQARVVVLLTHTTFRIKETPSAIVNKSFRVIVDCFHDLGPVQALNTFCVFNVT